jgi:frataxin-like iron-binding protein CyaY
MSNQSKYEIINVKDVDVTVDVSLLQKTDDLFFNATEIAKQFSKKPNEWLDSKQGQEYIAVILEAENLRFQNLVRISRGGKYQGTWLHKKLALPFARWLSVKFEYELDKWVQKRIDDEHQLKQLRLELKTGFVPLTNAIQAAHKEPKFYHYSNEINLINRLVTGMDTKKFNEKYGVQSVRDALTAEQALLMEKLQTQDTCLIELGFNYKQRKSALKDYATKFFDGGATTGGTASNVNETIDFAQLPLARSAL